MYFCLFLRQIDSSNKRKPLNKGFYKVNFFVKNVDILAVFGIVRL